MRLFVIAVTVLYVAMSLAMPALAQDMGHSRHKRTQEKTTAPAANKANDRDYKAALDRMPTPTEKYDPWGTARAPAASSDKH